MGVRARLGAKYDDGGIIKVPQGINKVGGASCRSCTNSVSFRDMEGKKKKRIKYSK